MSRTDDDPLFAGILSWWAVLGLGTAVALATIEPRPLFEELPDAWVRVADVRPRVRVVRPAPAPPKAEVAPRAAEGSPGPAPAKPSRDREPVGKTLLQVLGTAGESRTDLVARLFEDGGSGEVDLAEATAASPIDDGLRSGAGPDGPAGDVDLRLLAGTGEGVDLGVSVTVRARPPARAEPELTDGSSRKLPAAQIGGILYCYEKRLMANPDLLGRIEIGFESRPTVVVNDTGDDELASCIDRLARRWTMPDGFDTEATYPVLLRPK